MAGPILLVHDDLATIATARRLLGREGYEVILASSAADAVIAFGHHLPSLIVLAPAVEGERGALALEEIQQHPDGKLARVLLLGESIPGFAYPIAPLPLDADTFITQVNELVRSGSSAGAGDNWEVVEKAELAPVPEPKPETSRLAEDWRAQAPPDVTITHGDEPGGPTLAEELEGRLFGDLPSIEDEMHREIEAQAIAHVDSSLASLPRAAAPDGAPALLALERAKAIAQKARTEKRRAESAAQAAMKRLEGNLDSVTHQLTALNAQIEEKTSEALKLEAALAAQKADFAVKLKAAKDDYDHRLNAEREVARAGAEVEWKSRLDDEGLKALEQHTALEAQLKVAQESAQALKSQLEERTEWTTLLEKEVAGMRERAEKAEAASVELAAQVEALKKGLSEARHSSAEADVLKQQWERAFEDLKTSAAEAQEKLAKELNEAQQAAAFGVAERDALAQAQAQAIREAEKARAQLAAERDEALNAKAQAMAERDEAAQAQAQAMAQRDEAERAKAEAVAAQAVMTEQMLPLESNIAEQGRQIESLSEALAQAERALEAAREERTQLEERAEVAQLAAEGAERKVRELEAKNVMPLAPPGRAPLGVPRFGEVDLAGLAGLVLALADARADVRMELVVLDGKRTLWFQRGQLVAAESSFPLETLVHRARRDGLLDGRQESELRILHTAAPAESLNVLKSRGFVRELEVVPLVQRYTEQLALEAFSERKSSYRLADESPGIDVLVAASPRATLPLLTEALRRALSVDEVLESLGGTQAIPVPLDTELDARTLGFSDRERRLLALVDGQATVEEVTLASGLRQEAAFKVLLVGRLLGLFDLKAPAVAAPEVSGELDAQRLEAKYEEIQEADYFSILGLTRTAGAEEVQRAFERLSNEFDPIRFSGHPDVSLQQRAQRVHALLLEAAKALEDDRRRAEYARHLLD